MSAVTSRRSKIRKMSIRRSKTRQKWVLNLRHFKSFNSISLPPQSTFNYGIQLLNAAFALRQSCKLNSDTNIETIDYLKKTWKNLHAVSQEQMTRLRVSAVFYRSVSEQITKLEQLKQSVTKLKDVEDEEKKIFKLRKYLALRERLLVEVGRMMRLGRLLRTRLKEPFVLSNDLEKWVNF